MVSVFSGAQMPNLDFVCDKMDSTANSIYKKGDSFNKIYDNLIKYVEKEAPDFLTYFEKNISNYKELSDAYHKCAEEFHRSADDLRDIVERSAVPVRLEKEIDSLKKKYNNAQAKYENAHRQLNESLPETVKKEAEAKRVRLQAAKELHDALVYYKNYKQRFAKFSYTRTTQAYKRYGKAIENRANIEIKLCNSITNIYKAIVDNLRTPENILSQLDPNSASERKTAEPEKEKVASEPISSNEHKEEHISAAPVAAAVTETKKKAAPNPSAGNKRPLRKKRPIRKRPVGKIDNDEEIEINGFMYDFQENKESGETGNKEEEEKKDVWDFDDEDEPFTPIESNKKVPEPEVFNPEIDESTLDIKSVEKELFE